MTIVVDQSPAHPDRPHGDDTPVPAQAQATRTPDLMTGIYERSAQIAATHLRGSEQA